MSDMTHGEDDYSIDDGSVHMADFLRPITKSTMGDEVCLCLLPWQHFLFSLQDMQFKTMSKIHPPSSKKEKDGMPYYIRR
jgi:hypothetical protein